MADKVTELKQERAARIKEAREILNKADAESRDLTSEEQVEYDNLYAEADSLDKRAKREERQLEEERALLETSPGITGGDIDPASPEAAAEARQAEYRKAYHRYLRVGMGELTPEERQLVRTGEERSDQIVGTTTLGGFTVPTGFQRRLAEHQVQAGTMRQTRATILPTGTGEDIPVPKTTAHGTANWIGEGNAITPDAETFGQVTLKSYVVAEIIRVSVQLLADNAVDLEAYLARALAGNIGAAQNTAYYVGNGSSKPTGITTLTTLGKTAAAAAAIAADEILDVFYSVGPQYRGQAEWAMADTTVKALRKLKLSTGEYVWQAGLTAGEKDTLLGKPVHDDPDMPAIGSGNKSLIFGDFSGYYIRDAGGFVLRRLDERYADNLLVGFLAYTRTDGNLIDQTGAVKHLLHP